MTFEVDWALQNNYQSIYVSHEALVFELIVTLRIPKFISHETLVFELIVTLCMPKPLLPMKHLC